MKQSGQPALGFESFARGHTTCWVRPDARRWIESVLSTAPTLHAAAARLGGSHMSGRGPVYAVPTTSGVWVVRHFHRGGAIGPVLGDRYLARGVPRPFREASASQMVRGRGIPTPRVIAASVYRAGPFYRGDLVTELVPEAEELSEILFDPDRTGLAGTADRKEALRETGALVAKMARAGVRHPDLNAKNILLQWSGGRPTAYVLDLDRTTVGKARSSTSAIADSMLSRLLRSLRKFERSRGVRIPTSETDLLVDAARWAGE